MIMIGDIMKKKNVTSQQLSDMTGIKKQTIDSYRPPRMKEPSLGNGLKIADALGVDPHELIKKED